MDVEKLFPKVKDLTISARQKVMMHEMQTSYNAIKRTSKRL